MELKKYKEVSCQDVKTCTICPFGGSGLFKTCMKIKLEDNLGVAFESLKNELESNAVKKIERHLEREVRIY